MQAPLCLTIHAGAHSSRARFHNKIMCFSFSVGFQVQPPAGLMDEKPASWLPREQRWLPREQSQPSASWAEHAYTNPINDAPLSFNASHIWGSAAEAPGASKATSCRGWDESIGCPRSLHQLSPNVQQGSMETTAPDECYRDASLAGPRPPFMLEVRMAVGSLRRKLSIQAAGGVGAAGLAGVRNSHVVPAGHNSRCWCGGSRPCRSGTPGMCCTDACTAAGSCDLLTDLLTG